MKNKPHHNPRGNFVSKIMKLKLEGKLQTGVHELDIQHDDWCAIFKGGACNCNPNIYEIIRGKQ